MIMLLSILADAIGNHASHKQDPECNWEQLWDIEHSGAVAELPQPTVSTQSQVRMTTGTTPWQGLRERIGMHLQTITAHVDAAYDIPGAGMVYIFSGKRLFATNCLGFISMLGWIFSSTLQFHKIAALYSFTGV